MAVFLGWQSLIGYQSDAALVGGVSLPPMKKGHLYVPGSVYSPDGRCRPFDANAQGARASAGVGVAVLKRLEDALDIANYVLSLPPVVNTIPNTCP